MSLAVGIPIAALSALLLAVAYPPLEWRPLAFVALAPLLVAVRRLRLRDAMLCLLAWGEIFSFLVANALPEAVESYFQQPRWLSWVFAIGVWAGTGAIYFLGFGALQRALAGLRPGLQPLVVAAAWVSVELVRARLLTDLDLFVSNPWALVGYSQVGFDALMQISSVTGVYGVSFAVVAVNAALAELWLRRGASGPRWPVVVAGVLPVASAIAFGALVLRGADDRASPGIPVAVVQANIDIGARYRPELYGQNLDRYLRLTLQAIDEVRPPLVVWPEAALTFHLQEEPVYRETIARVLAEGDAQLVAGGPWGVPGDPPFFSNSVFVLDAAGRVGGRYDKQILVPFSEYTPSGGLALMRRNFGRFQEYARGPESGPLPTVAGRAGIAVCNEIMLPEVVRRHVLDGAEILMNPSNDTWVSERNWSQLVFQMSLVRAIEYRRYLVRASTSGPSAIVDPWGRVQIRSEALSEALIAGKVRPRGDLTPYARLGDSFALLCVAGVGVGVGVSRQTARGRRRLGPAQVPDQPECT
jgi:apolipoprotein N-acyltransferase